MKKENELYEMMFKRKSFRGFKDVENVKLTKEELEEIESAFRGFDCLYPDIKTEIKIVTPEKTTASYGQEYCILIYSEKKDNYLANIGYLGQQLDLFLASKNIASLWCGLGKTEEKLGNLEYAIMFLISKVDSDVIYRNDITNIDRKNISQIWSGEKIEGVSEVIRLAPSACNSQPWFVENVDNELLVYRHKEYGKYGERTAKLLAYFNKMDIGIFLCYLDLCLLHENKTYEKELFVDDDRDEEKILIAKYKIKEG